ncbi:restriction endonuclease subunit S [Nocardia terpenica]|uniref:Restriction endonuclease n=1 Tax=Nocardia terpenica TaxID=455432 RepID=A0A291RQK3_9NOCA|nr:restriction endonuclease subunit S [Nocardia terpenica]ATL69816.1 restriction endonuclease [Nocardia terpenica]
MSDWCETTLGDLIHVKHGYAFKGEFFADEGDALVLKPGNFPVGGGIQLRPGKDAYYTGGYPSEFELDPGDMLVVMTDLTQAAPILGSPAIVPSGQLMLHNQRLGLVQVKPDARVDRRFLYYLMLSDSSRSQIRATATGATVRHTAPERIYRVSVKLPDRSTQCWIGETLSSIDDLIENNRRRGQVLGEMARAIYQEWFVKFRYPGHETVALVGSTLGPIPLGWEAGVVGDLIQLQRGYDLPSKSRVPGEVPVVGASGIQGTHAVAKVNAPGITTGRSGTIGVVNYLADDFWPLNTSLWVKEFKRATPRYAFFALSSVDLRNAASGAAVPTLDRKVVHGIPIVCPPRALVHAWDTAVEPMFEEREVLRQENDRLVSLRDLLLEKLVTGKIDVSDLNLDGFLKCKEEMVA